MSIYLKFAAICEVCHEPIGPLCQHVVWYDEDGTEHKRHAHNCTAPIENGKSCETVEGRAREIAKAIYAAIEKETIKLASLPFHTYIPPDAKTVSRMVEVIEAEIKKWKPPQEGTLE